MKSFQKATGVDISPAHGLTEVHSSRVKPAGGFWGPRLKTHHDVTIPHSLNSLENDGHVTNFDKAAGVATGPVSGHPAFDSDLYKALEGAMYSMQQQPNDELLKRVDGILGRIMAAQQADGFLIAFYIIQQQDQRWEDLRLKHQMYNAGHYFEMAVEHNRLTGDNRVLSSAKLFADHINGIFGINKRYDVDGHQEVELALIKLFRATGEQRYLELARFFLDERGHAHGTERKPFDPATQTAPAPPQGTLTREQQREFWHAHMRIRNGRMQDHKPVVDQHEAIGHAVRAGYMYSAMADIVRFMGAHDYELALDDIWNDVIGRRMYLTGNIGTGQYDDEGFGDPYLLPNDSAYCETCAAIAHVLWQHRMAMLKGQSKYADVMELALYNGVMSGIAISGDQFFYQNPLTSQAGNRRRSWIGLSCCPTNMDRIIPQVGGFAYATGKLQLFVNLYIASEAAVTLDDGQSIKLVQQTEYPWDGRVKLTVTSDTTIAFDLCLRVPGWALSRPVPSDLYRFVDNAVHAIGLKVNGKVIDPVVSADGYIHLQRSWQDGDVIELDLPMPIRRVIAHNKVEADRGKIALMRGPILYCLESVDNPGTNLFDFVLPREAELTAEFRPDLLGGVTILNGKGLADAKNPVGITAIPYYALANREQGPMTVWISESSRSIVSSAR